MAGKVLNIKVCSPPKRYFGLTGNYHAICHYSYNLSMGKIRFAPFAHRAPATRVMCASRFADCLPSPALRDSFSRASSFKEPRKAGARQTSFILSSIFYSKMAMSCLLARIANPLYLVIDRLIFENIF